MIKACIVATITWSASHVDFQEVVATIQIAVTEDTGGPTLLNVHCSLHDMPQRHHWCIQLGTTMSATRNDHSTSGGMSAMALSLWCVVLVTGVARTTAVWPTKQCVQKLCRSANLSVYFGAAVRVGIVMRSIKCCWIVAELEAQV